jgi:hypothetical protein
MRFCDVCNYLREGRGKRGDLSFYSEFCALSDGVVKSRLWEKFENVKILPTSIFDTLTTGPIGKIIKYHALD